MALHVLHTYETRCRRTSCSVAGTYKGILHRADVSEDAKNHAREILDKMGVAHDD